MDKASAQVKKDLVDFCIMLIRKNPHCMDIFDLSFAGLDASYGDQILAEFEQNQIRTLT